MIIQSETIFIQLSSQLFQESRGHSSPNSNDRIYWAFKTAVEIKKDMQQYPLGLASDPCKVIAPPKIVSLISPTTI
jgi:hypothetical protein